VVETRERVDFSTKIIFTLKIVHFGVFSVANEAVMTRTCDVPHWNMSPKYHSACDSERTLLYHYFILLA